MIDYRKALQRIANLPLSQFKGRPDPHARARRIAIAALRSTPLVPADLVELAVCGECGLIQQNIDTDECGNCNAKDLVAAYMDRTIAVRVGENGSSGLDFKDLTPGEASYAK